KPLDRGRNHYVLWHDGVETRAAGNSCSMLCTPRRVRGSEEKNVGNSVDRRTSGPYRVYVRPGAGVLLRSAVFFDPKGCATMNLLTTLAGSLMEGFFPAGWDLARIDRLADAAGAELVRRCAWWHPQFEPVACATVAAFDTYVGHEIAREIQRARQDGRL